MMIAYIAPFIDKVPRHQRYRYGSRLEDGLWELVRLIIEAGSSGQKSKIYRLDDHIRFLHALLRHGAELGWVKAGPVGEAAKHLINIGKMVGKWKYRLQHGDNPHKGSPGNGQ